MQTPFFLRAIGNASYDKRDSMKPKIYKIGSTWILWYRASGSTALRAGAGLFNTRSSSVRELLSS